MARQDGARSNLYDDITTKIIAELEQGRLPWAAAAKAPFIAALVGHAKGTVPSKYVHLLGTTRDMAADTIEGYIQGLLDGQSRHPAYRADP